MHWRRRVTTAQEAISGQENTKYTTKTQKRNERLPAWKSPEKEQAGKKEHAGNTKNIPETHEEQRNSPTGHAQTSAGQELHEPDTLELLIEKCWAGKMHQEAPSTRKKPNLTTVTAMARCRKTYRYRTRRPQESRLHTR